MAEVAEVMLATFNTLLEMQDEDASDVVDYIAETFNTLLEMQLSRRSGHFCELCHGLSILY